MVQSPRYSLPFRRRREGRTDYKLRLGLIRSGKRRAVVRCSNMYVQVQIVESRSSGDFVSVAASSRELLKLGWKGGRGNLPSAYLTGLLAGRRAMAKGVGEAVLDVGLRRSTKGSRVYAALKGMADSGLVVPHSEEILPPIGRLTGSHISEYAKGLLSESSDAYKKRFSRYLGSGLKPEDLPGHFEQVKAQLMSLKVGVES